MALERRARVTLLLPAPTTPAQFLQVDAILTELVQVCGGVTVSSRTPSVFDGWWFDPHEHQVREDANFLVFADAPVPVESADLVAYLERLKLRCQGDFAQDLIWMTVHHVDRVAAHDP